MKNNNKGEKTLIFQDFLCHQKKQQVLSQNKKNKNMKKKQMKIIV